MQYHYEAKPTRLTHTDDIPVCANMCYYYVMHGMSVAVFSRCEMMAHKMHTMDLELDQFPRHH